MMDFRLQALPNPHRGRRTLGPSEAEVNELVDGVLRRANHTTVTILNQPLTVASFDVQNKMFGDYETRRADGSRVPFRIVLSVEDDAAASRLPVGGIGRYEGKRVIGLVLRTQASFALDTWKDLLRGFFAHELTHLKDPSVESPRRRGAPRSTLENLWQPEDDAALNAYLNDPAEVIARRHEIYRDLHRPAVAKVVHHFAKRGTPRHQIVETVLNAGSDTWREIKTHLTKANQRVMRQMAAGVVLKLLDEPKGSLARRRPACSDAGPLRLGASELHAGGGRR